MTEGTGTESLIYIDQSDVRAEHWEELKAAIHDLVSFVENHQPQMATYAFYLDEEANEMTVVSVHPDSHSLERHIEVGGPEFKKLAPYLELREIEVFGSLSDRARSLVHEKARALGDGGSVVLHPEFEGFSRLV